MQKINKPNLFIIGAPKCGTTSLTSWLNQHPNIYMSPVKEPGFFSRDIATGSVSDFEKYLDLFKDATPEHIWLSEASTSYLFSQVAVPEIEKKFPNSRYIVMLRNPVDMAYSLHGQRLLEFENIDEFYEAWKMTSSRLSGDNLPWGCPNPVLLDYPSWCSLGMQMERLFTTISREQVLTILLEDAKNNPHIVYSNIMEFLDIPNDGPKEFPLSNSAKKFRWAGIARKTQTIRNKIHSLREHLGVRSFRLKWLANSYDFMNEKFNLKPHARAPIPPTLREELTEFFSEDIEKLESILNVDLSAWRTVK